MAKRRRDQDDDGAKDASPEYNVVFVDTSVDTHLAILVSNFDTVSDFKKKLQLEYGQCFPKIGEIQIQSLKVKRGANFYHLPDVVPVWSAFHGENGDWFLSADVSVKEDDVEIDGMNIEDNCKRLTSDIKRTHNLSIFLPDSVSGKNVVADTTALFEVQKSLETTTGSQSNNCSEANSMGRKKRKVSPAVVVYQNPTLKENCNLLLESGKVTSMLKIIGSGDSMAGAGEEGSEALHLSEQQVKISKAIADVSAIRSYQSDIEEHGRSVGASSPATSEKSISGSMNENPLGSDMRKQESRSKSTLSTENFVINEPEQEPGHNQMGAIGGPVQDADSNKKMILKSQIGKVGNTMPNTETLRCQEKGSSLKQDSELLLPSMCKTPEHAEPTLMLQEANFSLPSLNPNASAGPEISSGSKKKKKRDNKGGSARLGKSATRQKDNIVNATSGSLCPSPDCTAPLGKEDSPMKFLDSSAIHANVKVQDADRGGDDPMLLTKQMVVDMVNVKENMGEKSQCETEMPALERENLVMVFDQVEDKKNREGKDTEPRKKRKKSKHRASNSQVKMSVTDRNLDNVVLENKENLVVDSEEKGRHGASQFLSQRSDERLEEMHGTPGNTDDPARINNELFPGTSLSKRPDNEPGQDLATDYCASASVDLANSSARLLGTTAAFPETKSDGNKKRKKKLLKDILDTTSTDQNDKVENNLAICVLSEKHDPELIMPSNCKSSEHDGPALMPDKARFSPPVSDANAIVGPEIASGSKKKLKRRNKCADPNHKVHGANRDATNFVQLNQNKQLVEDAATGKEKMGEKTQWEEEAPGMERESQVLEFDQGDKEKSRSKDTKSIKKRKKKKTKSSVSNIQVNLTAEDQRVDTEVLANEEKSCGIVNPEEESRNAGTSQLLSQKNDQVLENVQSLSINRDDPARGKNEGEEINFREYFVRGEDPCKVDSVDMVKRSSKLNGEMKSGEKVKEKRSLTISGPIESSLVNQENKCVSRIRKVSGMEQGDSVQDSAWDEVISNSSTVPLRVSQTEVKDSSRIHMDNMNAAPKGPRTNQIVSSRLKENSIALDKSSSRRSEFLTEKKLNNRSQSGLNATNRLVVKTQPMKSLLTKSGSIFQDDSGESSADENEKVQSDHSTLGPTNSSSESEYSDGESDLSPDSSRNGSSEVTGRSKATQKLDLSGSNGMTIDVILKSSNWFREAKLVAQTENDIDNQLVETVPESEPI